MSLKQYILDENNQPVECSLEEWAKFFESPRRIIKRSEFANGEFISTIFLGIDHGWGDGYDPLLFESMTFEGGSMSGTDQQRYTTYDDALKGHDAMVAAYLVRKGGETLVALGFVGD